jgi:hypothetical protein
VFEPHLTDVVLPAVRSASGTPRLAAWRVTSIHPDNSVAVGHARTRLAQYLSSTAFDAMLQHAEWAALPAQLQAASGRAGWAEGGH